MLSRAEEITGTLELCSNSFKYNGDEVRAPDTAITLYPWFLRYSVVYSADGALSAVTITFFTGSSK